MTENEKIKTSFDRNKEELEKNYENKIFKLNKTIMEKDIEINSLQSKILEFSKNIEELNIENNMLKRQIKIIENHLNKTQTIYPENILQIQPTQRFIVFNESSSNSFNQSNFLDFINNNNIKQFDNSSNRNTNYITNYFNTKIIPFKLQPFKEFDHRKLNINYKDLEHDFLDEELLNEIKKNNTTIIDNMTNYSIEHNINRNYSIEQIDNSNISIDKKSDKNLEGMKLHSSLFFKNCKKVMNKNEYRNLIEIVKLSNLKKISKEETFLKITSLLDNKYPELSKEFKLLFI